MCCDEYKDCSRSKRYCRCPCLRCKNCDKCAGSSDPGVMPLLAMNMLGEIPVIFSCSISPFVHTHTLTHTHTHPHPHPHPHSHTHTHTHTLTHSLSLSLSSTCLAVGLSIHPSNYLILNPVLIFLNKWTKHCVLIMSRYKFKSQAISLKKMNARYSKHLCKLIPFPFYIHLCQYVCMNLTKWFFYFLFSEGYNAQEEKASILCIWLKPGETPETGYLCVSRNVTLKTVAYYTRDCCLLH